MSEPTKCSIRMVELVNSTQLICKSVSPQSNGRTKLELPALLNMQPQEGGNLLIRLHPWPLFADEGTYAGVDIQSIHVVSCVKPDEPIVKAYKKNILGEKEIIVPPSKLVLPPA